ncbi:response regulator [Xanthomonas sp. Kuri4-1]
MARILIVDDSPSQLLGIQRIVEKLGHQTLTATDGAAGVEVAKAALPDLVLMDVVLPGMSGFQATRAMARDEATRHIPVLIVSTKSMETDKAWGLRQGAAGYIVKPPREDDLIARIQQLVG